MLLLVGKHTWGGHTIIEPDGGATDRSDTTHYTTAQLRQVRWSSPNFIVQESSWDEQRLELWAVRKVLGAASTLGKAIDAEMAQLTGPAAMKPLVPDDSRDWKELPRGRWGDRDYVLAAIASGLIFDVIANR